MNNLQLNKYMINIIANYLLPNKSKLIFLDQLKSLTYYVYYSSHSNVGWTDHKWIYKKFTNGKYKKDIYDGWYIT